jgi:outer membrane usher protein
MRNGQVRPVEFHEVRMRVGDQEMTFPTGKNGEFYLENIKAGTYKASFKDGEKPCTFDIIIPETDEMIIDLGGVTCETVR